MNTHQPTRILITSGATQEPIDEVRFLGNRSSGLLATLLAFESAVQGYEVTILHGNGSLDPPSHPRIRSMPFSSERDLQAKLHELWPSHTILIMAAAVADFTPKGGQLQGKVHRDSPLTIELSPTEDIVHALAEQSREDQRILAFALEEQKHLIERAKAKQIRKNVTAIVANPLETMQSNVISASVFCKNGECIQPEEGQSKPQFAVWLIENLASILETSLVTSLDPSLHSNT